MATVEGESAASEFCKVGVIYGKVVGPCGAGVEGVRAALEFGKVGAQGVSVGGVVGNILTGTRKGTSEDALTLEVWCRRA